MACRPIAHTTLDLKSNGLEVNCRNSDASRHKRINGSQVSAHLRGQRGHFGHNSLEEACTGIGKSAGAKGSQRCIRDFIISTLVRDYEGHLLARTVESKAT
jgi:hypothetical protein